MTGPTVEGGQGPAWVVNVPFDPPLWAEVVFYGGVLLAFALVARTLYYRGWSVGVSKQWEMLREGGIAVGIVAATLTSVRYLNGPYLADVALGFLGGQLLGRSAVRAAPRAVARLDAPETPRARLGLAWALLAAVAPAVSLVLVPPGMAAPLVEQGGTLLFFAGITAAVANLWALDTVSDRIE